MHEHPPRAAVVRRSEDRTIQLLPIVAILCWAIGFELAAARMATRLDRFAAAWGVFGRS